MPFFTYTDADGEPCRFEIKKKLTTIGRGKNNDLCLPDKAMMPQHAHILADGKNHMISSLDPKATIVVVGYPRVFNPGDVSCSQANGISWSGASEAGEPRRSRPMPDCRWGSGHVGVPGRGFAAEVPPTTRSRGDRCEPAHRSRPGTLLGGRVTSEDGAAGVVERA